MMRGRTSTWLQLFSRNITIKVGQTMESTRKFTADDVLKFSEVSHDKNPLHFEGEISRNSQFKAPIVHGMLVGSMFSALIGNSIPGSIYLGHNFKWVQPVFVGDTITAKVEVIKLKSARAHVMATMRATCVNQNSVLVLDGEAICRYPESDEPKQ
mmetsp:Transcript_47190/g.125413  ORF Transcript_47190/g.125413 Transcript_47190/m.125413 type:complete len:155 (-) Transcript_47190:118-582(-)